MWSEERWRWAEASSGVTWVIKPIGRVAEGASFYQKREAHANGCTQTICSLFRHLGAREKGKQCFFFCIISCGWGFTSIWSHASQKYRLFRSNLVLLLGMFPNVLQKGLDEQHLYVSPAAVMGRVLQGSWQRFRLFINQTVIFVLTKMLDWIKGKWFMIWLKYLEHCSDKDYRFHNMAQDFIFLLFFILGPFESRSFNSAGFVLIRIITFLPRRFECQTAVSRLMARSMKPNHFMYWFYW